ncbi:MAG: efflux RND transporter permease subunit [Rhodocyclaceae bacterium]|nr:efflux RND transporter permease subunit [Rhodocyclaceae bacterium]
MKTPNLSEWAVHHPAMVTYLMVVLLTAGIFSYLHLGRAEDPDFTFKAMVVRTVWPGATAKEVEQQVTERLEKKIHETPWVDVLRSRSTPGESLVFILLKDHTPPSAVPDAWYQVRKNVNDIRYALPEGVQGPFFNDDFGDVFGNIFALTGDGFDLAALRKEADRIARDLQNVADVKRVELLGVQEEKVWIEVSHAKLATLGLSPQALFDALQKQNAMTPAGHFDTSSDRVTLHVSGQLNSVEAIRSLGIQAGGRLFRLGDIANVRRGYSDPPETRFRYQGQDAIGIAVSMGKGGDIIALGQNLRREMARLEAGLPRGIEIHTVSDQPRVVKDSIHEFTSSLFEAVAIVLAVSFLSLGVRTGTVVALTIPLVLAVTFLCMKLFGIALQKVSLGALIIALGLLVDDAIIAVEMMVVKMEEGWEKARAATFAYTSTAFPMLTGTLVTAAGFLPVGFAKSAAGEYTFSIFAVVAIALLVSWVVAVIFTPYLGYRILDAGQLRAKAALHGDDPYQSPFYRRLHRVIHECVKHRRLVIIITVAAFGLALLAFGTVVQKQFFPASNRTEVMVDLWLPQSASFKATEADVRRVEALLRDDPAVEQYVAYVGGGSARFVLPLDQQLDTLNFAQFVVLSKGLKEREELMQRLNTRFAAGFTNLRARVQRLENGPPVGFPVQFRVMGEDEAEVRRLAAKVADVVRSNPNARNVQLDWNEMTRTVRLDVDQDRARALGASSQEISFMLQSLLVGTTITRLREGDQLIDVVGRAEEEERQHLSQVKDMNILIGSASGGRYVPLSQVAKLSYGLEEGIIWRRNRLPTITVRADIREGVEAPVVSKQIEPDLAKLQATFPSGYHVETGGAIEEAAKGEDSIMAVMPAMVLTVVTLLMMQLQSMGRTIMVLLTAPLGLIGVALMLVVFHVPFGFVANLGVIALFGMIMRNSVILVDQIEHDRRLGRSTEDAIVGSAVRRFRPIMLTAAAAILAMIPLTRSIFWGPMAVAIMGGLLVATVLTLLVVPALYASLYLTKAEREEPATS